MNCPYCNQVTIPDPNVTGFKICTNHEMKAAFYPSLNWTIFITKSYNITLHDNKTILSLYDGIYNSYKTILSLPYRMDITPESFNSTLDKLLKLKMFL